MKVDTLLHKPVLLEVNALITVHGTLEIDAGGNLSFDPALDARLMGQAPLFLPLEKIRGVRRTDGGRRVVVEADSPIVFRGPAGFVAWLILGAMLDCRGSELGPVFLKGSAHGRLGRDEGLVTVARTGFGFAASENSLISGSLATTWLSLNDMERVRPDFPGLHIFAAGQSLVLDVDAPLVLRDRLVKRWFDQADPRMKGATWTRLAVRRVGLEVIFGRLGVTPAGLVFVAQGEDQPDVLIPRRRAGVLAMEFSPHVTHEDGFPVELIHIGTEEDNLSEFQVADPAVCSMELEALLSDAAWFPEDKSANPLFTQITGPAAYVMLWRGHDLLASRNSVALAPFAGKLKLKLDAPMDYVSVPTAVRVEVANKKGRFLLTGVLTQWQAPKPSKAVPVTERHLLISLADEMIEVNRRGQYRFPLKDKLDACYLQSPPTSGRSTLPPNIQIEGAVLLDISRTGACLWMPRRAAMDMRVIFTLVVESGERIKVEDGKDAVEVEVETFHLGSQVIYVMESSHAKAQGWRVGLRFEEGCGGPEAFDARQRVFLRHRAEEKEERSF
jgi:hypothetical protein